MPTTQPFLVYRDRIGVASEIGFLCRQYIGFTRLSPVWIGRTLLPAAEQIGPERFRIGGGSPLGPLQRWLFRHAGRAPPLPSSEAIVHAQFARGGALALPIAMALDARLVVTLHGGDVSKQKNWMGTVLARRWAPLIRKTAKFVCVSAAVADIAALRGVPAEKLAVLPIGVEVPQEVPDRSAERREAHLFVGRFVEKKGINVLVNAMRRLRAEGDQTPLVCVGAGPLRPVLFALSREIPGVTLTGWLPPEAVRAQMAKAISVIVPSIVAGDGDSEGLPSVIPEAMMQGCAVIGSNQGGIAEVIRDGETGLLFAPNDPEALADAMGRITADTTIGLAGLAYARSELNAQVQSVKLEDLLLGG